MKSMAQKHRKNQSKLDAMKASLKKLEERTARQVKGRLGAHWRDNLFEIIMTRLELAALQKKAYTSIPAELCKSPAAAPSFAKFFLRSMRNILKLAKAPSTPLHVAGFGVLYINVIDVFLKDNTRDHSKTMAVLDKRLELFERLAAVF